MKKIRWSDFSLVSKIMIEVGVLAVLLFSINMLFYARINNSMQEMDDVYASNAQHDIAAKDGKRQLHRPFSLLRFCHASSPTRSNR